MAVADTNGGAPPNKKAKAAHVNMMTDTVIANLPPDALRSLLRGLLGVEQNLTSHFHDMAAKYLLATKPKSTPSDLFTANGQDLGPTNIFFETQARIRCLMGCGFGFDTISTLTDVLRQLLKIDHIDDFVDEQLAGTLASIDGDIVQAVTAVQKELLTGSGLRVMSPSEQEIIKRLRDALALWSSSTQHPDLKFAFARGFTRLAEFEGRGSVLPKKRQTVAQSGRVRKFISETVRLGNLEFPRMFAGLWQFSSPAWGTASRPQINKDFRKHVDAGFTAYGTRWILRILFFQLTIVLDMADHYGDAEVTFVSSPSTTRSASIQSTNEIQGQFRSAQPDRSDIYCATKLCIFGSVEVTPEFINSNVDQRAANIESDSIELLQFHWQDVSSSITNPVTF